ncbi:Amino acid permease 2 [Chlorella sorokiniana]|uniref:Amino acid permease 2 n=1 Tax=Chlorella sorokiniana TaxID=3076 RepID=A0A2P6TLS4_CHLSO|nr:Amino acid permease 2 [Chlorella sorokiniana]|eukprot:PRW45225.1 Amino acid permease 2 [Chlorella sorokiniana]
MKDFERAAAAAPEEDAPSNHKSGPLLIALFWAVTMASAHMLRQLYCVNGVEFARYHHAVRYVLGDGWGRFIAATQLLSCILGTTTYSLAGSNALIQFVRGVGGSKPTRQWEWLLILGGIQVLLSQIPSLAELWWVGTLATLLAGCFCGLTLIMGALAAADGTVSSGVGGIPSSPADKAFNVLASMGVLAFAYTFCEILMEIQDTLRQPPAAKTTMKRALNLGVTAAAIFYMAIGGVCYAALGNATPGMVLDGFQDDPGVPTWLIMTTWLLLALQTQMVWQIWAQPVFDSIESHLKPRLIRRAQAAAAAREAKAAAVAAGRESSRSKATDGSEEPEEEYLLPPGWLPKHPSRLGALPPPQPPPVSAASSRLRSMLGAVSSLLDSHAVGLHMATGAENEHVPLNETGFVLPWWQRTIIRSSVVAAITMVSILIPFFSVMISFVGACAYWPLTIAAPYAMYRKVYSPRPVVRRAMAAVEVGMLLVCLGAAVGAFRQMVVGWQDVQFFQ